MKWNYALGGEDDGFVPGEVVELAGRFRTRTPVDGFFLAGQGVLLKGLSPVLLSGRLATRAAERFTERRGRLPTTWPPVGGENRA
ncbi:hypothetical protein [Vitiosangium sp. GDMCC 1.1324]|uniref:hypothetical protein n=1 Tax=Vitiosangium sp. (strain GDMCC 1.1324) TaxID=2138576 RepID=UPI0011B79809|nr:hypothetical protein [Vitiosangium sp. GDMCC 1.1324]